MSYINSKIFSTGTDENAIIELLGSRTNKQRAPMVAAYKTTYGKVYLLIFCCKYFPVGCHLLLLTGYVNVYIYYNIPVFAFLFRKKKEYVPTKVSTCPMNRNTLLVLHKLCIFMPWRVVYHVKKWNSWRCLFFLPWEGSRPLSFLQSSEQKRGLPFWACISTQALQSAS